MSSTALQHIQSENNKSSGGLEDKCTITLQCTALCSDQRCDITACVTSLIQVGAHVKHAQVSTHGERLSSFCLTLFTCQSHTALCCFNV